MDTNTYELKAPAVISDIEKLQSLTTIDDDVLCCLEKSILKGDLTEEAFHQLTIMIEGIPNKNLIYQTVYRVNRLYRSIMSLDLNLDLSAPNARRRASFMIEKAVYDILQPGLVNIYEYGSTTNMLQCVTHGGKGIFFNIKMGEGSVGRAIFNPVMSTTTYGDNDILRNDLLLCETGRIHISQVTSQLIVPILDESNQQLLGFIQCFNKLVGVFNKTDGALLQYITLQLTRFINKINKYKTAEREIIFNNAIQETLKSVAKKSFFEEHFLKVVEVSSRMIGCDRFALFMRDHSNEDLWYKYPQKEVKRKFKFSASEGVAGSVAASGQSVNITDAHNDKRFNSNFDGHENYDTNTILSVALFGLNHQPVAIFQCLNKLCTICDCIPCLKHNVQFDNEDIKIMENFACEIANAMIAKAKLSMRGQVMDASFEEPLIDEFTRVFFCVLEPNSLESLEYDDVPTEKADIAPDIIDKLSDWSLDAFECDLQELLEMSEAMFDILDLPVTYNIPKPVLRKFLLQMSKLYLDNPYHNFRHAFTVMHMCFVFLTRTRASTIVENINKLALMVAAISHDARHPGISNDSFLLSEQTLYHRYNVLSFLERFHASILFDTLKEPEMNVLSNLSESDDRHVRSTIIEAILHTDMAIHTLMQKILSKRVQENPNFSSDIEDQRFILNYILHSCDIGSPAMAMHINGKWSGRMQTELNLQANLQEMIGLESSGYLKDSTSKALVRMNINFIGLVEQLWKDMSIILPDLSSAMENISANKKFWEESK